MLKAAGNHTLRFRLGSDENGSMLSTMGSILSSPGFDGANISIEFNIDVDVAKMTADGSPLDTSPNKILSKGKLPPMIDKSDDVSVDFYDSNHLVGAC